MKHQRARTRPGPSRGPPWKQPRAVDSAGVANPRPSARWGATSPSRVGGRGGVPVSRAEATGISSLVISTH